MGGHHDTREVDCSQSVEDEEQGEVGEGSEAGHQPCRHEHGCDVEVGEVGSPGWRLVLADTGNDGDVLGGICRVQQAQTATCIQDALSIHSPQGSFEAFKD